MTFGTNVKVEKSYNVVLMSVQIFAIGPSVD